MNVKFYGPTRVFMDQDCLKLHADRLKSLGKTALIMTGRSSAKANGSADDMKSALESQGVAYHFFDEVESNPTIETCRKAAAVAKQVKADFIIGIGGGSPLDAAKAAALLVTNDLEDSKLFSNNYEHPALPIVAVPTTSGTGSEVTQFSILTNDSIQGKSSIAWDGIFPTYAFLDAKYTESLPRNVTVNTALDALSHSVESYLSNNADTFSRILAVESIKLLGPCLHRLDKGTLDHEVRQDLLFASNLAGLAIAQTFTSVVHGMGYYLTYFKHVDHGRANGLLLCSYLKFLALEEPDLVNSSLIPGGFKGIEDFEELLNSLLGEKEKVSLSEAKKYAALAIKGKHLANTRRRPSEDSMILMYQESLSR